MGSNEERYAIERDPVPKYDEKEGVFRISAMWERLLTLWLIQSIDFELTVQIIRESCSTRVMRSTRYVLTLGDEHRATLPKVAQIVVLEERPSSTLTSLPRIELLNMIQHFKDI